MKRTFEDDLLNFLTYISSEKGLSQNTRTSYEFDLTSFIQFIEKKCTSCLDVKPTHIVQFLAHLSEVKVLSDASIQRSLMTLRVFFRFLKREGDILSDPSLMIEGGKVWQKIPEVLTVKEVFQLMECLAISLRDRAIIKLMYAAGLRVSEVCSLDLSHVGDTTIRVIGKGGKERIVPVAPSAITLLDRYLSTREGDEKALFLTSRGKRMNRRTIWSIVKHGGIKAKITKKISPHTLRHSFATHLIENSADLRVIQELLGHSDISTTERYMHISRSHIQRSFDTFHPRGG